MEEKKPPYYDKQYWCETCGSTDGACDPQTGLCYHCGADDWEPVENIAKRTSTLKFSPDIPDYKWSAKTPFGVYIVDKEKNRYVAKACFDMVRPLGRYEELDKAMQACNQDLKKRLSEM